MFSNEPLYLVNHVHSMNSRIHTVFDRKHPLECAGGFCEVTRESGTRRASHWDVRSVGEVLGIGERLKECVGMILSKRRWVESKIPALLSEKHSDHLR